MPTRSTGPRPPASSKRPLTRSAHLPPADAPPAAMNHPSWSPSSSSSSVFQPSHYPSTIPPPLASGSYVKDEPSDVLSGHFPALRLASASEAESTQDDDDDDGLSTDYSRRPLKAVSSSTGKGSTRASTRGSKGSKRAKVSEEEEEEGEGEGGLEGESGGTDGVTRKLSLKTRNRLKQRAHRERRALHLSTLESQVSEMAALKTDLATAHAQLAHADAVAQGQRMTYEAMIRDLSMRDREREGLLLAFQSEIFRLRGLVALGEGKGEGAGAMAEDAGQAGGDASSTTTVPTTMDGSKLEPNGGQAGSLQQQQQQQQQIPPPPQSFPFPGMVGQQPFYFFAPPPPPQAGQAPTFGGQQVIWHGPPGFGPPSQAEPVFHQRPGPPPPLVHQHSHTHLHLTPNGAPAPSSSSQPAEGMPYNLFPPHLRPQATGLSPKAPSPESTSSASAVDGGSRSQTSPALSQHGFGAEDGGGRLSKSTSPLIGGAGGPNGQVIVTSPPIASSSKLLSTLPQLQTSFQRPPGRSTVGGGEEDKDGLTALATSPSILTPTAAAPHPNAGTSTGGGGGGYPSGAPMPSPFSAFPYGYSTSTSASREWSFLATTPTNGMGSALWGGGGGGPGGVGGLGVPGQGQQTPWPWMFSGGGTSPVATSPHAWAAWGNPPSARPSSSGQAEGEEIK